MCADSNVNNQYIMNTIWKGRSCMKQDLSGVWQFALDQEKKGIDQKFYKRTALEDTIVLPTTTAEAKKGVKETQHHIHCLTEPYHFEGYAWYLKELTILEEEAGKRFFFVMERTRKSTVWVDGQQVGHFESFYVQHQYELTKYLAPGVHTIVVLIDNTDYVISGGHMTSEDTQTNWNGIVGDIYLESTDEVAIEQMRLYPSRADKTVQVHLDLSYINRENIAIIQKEVAAGKNFVDRDAWIDEKEVTLQVKITCKRTKLEKKKGKEYEHFEPVAMQPAWLRQECKKQELPYDIHTLEQLPDEIISISLHRQEEIRSDCFAQKSACTMTYSLGETAREWDEYDPNVYELTVYVLRDTHILCEKTSYFGLREFAHEGLKLLCNDKEIFLRGTHDGLIFPLTGYAPMDIESWIHIYGTSMEYGLNHYRYHTSCPPRAAFLAASYLGIYVEAELPFWGDIYDQDDENYPKAQQDFLLEEGLRTLDAYGDLPAYFGMSMGNELWGSKKAINEMMGIMKAHDPRHLYTQGSNNHQFVPSILPNDDFFCGVRFSKERLFRGSYAMCDAPQGFVQTKKPGAYWEYDEMICPSAVHKEETESGTIQIQFGTGVKEVHVLADEQETAVQVPVISHEIGQYEFMPDFDEIEQYRGVLQPENLKTFRERVKQKGLLDDAKNCFAASGKLAVDCYKLELEAALRSANLSGFQLLDIKDFSGQGTALVGILNAFMRNKGAVTKKKWRMFCSDAVLLPTLDSFVMKSADRIPCNIKLRYYHPETIENGWIEVCWYLQGQKIKETIDIPHVHVSGRGLFTVGELELEVPECENNEMYTLCFTLCKYADKASNQKVEITTNEYEIFVYNETKIGEHTCNDDGICITNDNKEAIKACKEGKAVLLFVCPGSMLPQDIIQGDYCTDFWCYPMFRSISQEAKKPVPIGTMGLLVNNTHPALSGFASQEYTTAQWYPIVVHSNPMILDCIESIKNLKPIVRMMDNFERNHNLGLIYEGKFHAGRLLICHADLLTLKKEYPEAAILYNSLVDYVTSQSFQPQEVLIK